MMSLSCDNTTEKGGLMVFNYSKLRGKIKELYSTESAFAEALKMNRSTLSCKLNNQVNFDQEDIVKISKLLNIAVEEIPIYFFTI